MQEDPTATFLKGGNGQGRPSDSEELKYHCF